MIIMQVLYKPCQCADGAIDIHLYLTIEKKSSSDSRSCCFRISSLFTIWRHWSTLAAWCWIYLGNLDAAALDGTGSACGERSRRKNSCLITVWYVDGCITIPRRPFYYLPNSDWMVDAFV